MVLFRIMQGAAGAAMMPLSQAILFETFPPSEHTIAMATFGLGMMAAPILGPTLGDGSRLTGVGAGTFTSTCRRARSPR